jgi:hypothetical protein
MSGNSELPNSDAYLDLKAILSDIIADVAPNEVPEFDESGMELLERAFAPRLAGSRNLPALVEAGLLAAHLVAGAFALIEIYRARRERQDQKTLENELNAVWRQALVDAGLSPGLADQIPMKYSPDMIRFIMKYVNKESRDRTLTPSGDAATKAEKRKAARRPRF